jgi:hypothetical protein
MSPAPEETTDEVALEQLEEKADMGDNPLKEEAIDSGEESEISLKEKQAPDDSKEEDKDDEDIVKLRKQAWLFHRMAIHPWFYMLFWPILFAFLIGFGWTQEDIIEDEVTNIWIPTSGSYYNDVSYAASLGEEDLPTSSFAAMAIARDGGNLFTESRLEEIRTRMEKTEKTTVRNKRRKRNICCLLLPCSRSHVISTLCLSLSTL